MIVCEIRQSIYSNPGIGAQIEQTARLHRYDWTPWCHASDAVLQVSNWKHKYATCCDAPWANAALQSRELLFVQGYRESYEAAKKWWTGSQDPTAVGHE